jgi:hypothetical protein
MNAQRFFSKPFKIQTKLIREALLRFFSFISLSKVFAFDEKPQGTILI